MSLKKSQPLYRVGLVGATGLVGNSFLNVLKDEKFSISELKLFASKKNAGKKILWNKKYYPIYQLSKKNLENLDFVFFSAGSKISKAWAPVAKKNGAWVIDNSSAFRKKNSVPLIVPEVNFHQLNLNKKNIIANPNCSTIQLVAAIHHLKKQVGIKSLQVATYQSISGAGKKYLLQLITESYAITKNLLQHKAHLKLSDICFPKKTALAFNLLPSIGKVNAQNFSEEEEKIINESRRILQSPRLNISAFAIRVPTLNTHGEAVWIELNKKITKAQLLKMLSKDKNISIVKKNIPLTHLAHQKPNIFISRIRRNPNNPHSWLLWITSDNTLKGAALNAVQIAKKISEVRRAK
ncbi:MAG: aspartate-semialdehyde dehydrogenase [Bdellovibrionaceae bacterium]|nr:aspartate-semialdehyde dehydrogenase [Pseudobdellovibrionaceae bacterium]